MTELAPLHCGDCPEWRGGVDALGRPVAKGMGTCVWRLRKGERKNAVGMRNRLFYTTHEEDRCLFRTRPNEPA